MMKINDLFKKDNTIYRVLSISGSDIQIIDCVKRTMPRKVGIDFFRSAEQVSEEELREAAGINLVGYDNLTQPQKKEVHNKYGSISLILPFINDDYERNRAIELCADKFKLSKATIKNRLCDYLAFQDIGIFLPDKEKVKKPLTADEKIFRWALNKYYYNGLKLPLKECYRRMLKDKYCDEHGKLLSKVPTFRQFNYYFYKTVKQENLIISREGKGKFMRDYRVMLGNGIRDFCPSIGYGMFDSTVCDIFLVNDKGELLGRPTLTACVDGYSSLCMGYSLGFNKGIQSLKDLIENIVADKKEHCKKFGIDIDVRDWNCNRLPHKFITDKGREYTSETFSQIAELGIEIINLPPYRPELKGAVEKFFDVIQGYYKKELATKGVIFEDYQERGGVDYRKKAALTIRELEKIIVLCILKYNSKRVINLPFDKVGSVQPFASALWNSCLAESKNNLIAADDELLRLTLLPRCTGYFKRDGLNVNKLRYKNVAYTERYLKGGECVVAYNPDNVSKVWLYENGVYTPFDIIETYFGGMDLEEVGTLKERKKQAETDVEEIALQGSIDLSRDIEIIADSVSLPKVDIKNVRKHRKTEVKKGGNNE
ncbi:MAG: transposase family protein [Roseburia sp.]|nr:transposase family protein [Roseburia sp.]